MKQKTFCMRKRGCNSLCKSLHQSYKSKKPFPFREQICFHYKVFACMPVMAEKATAQLFTDRTVLVHGKHRGQADSGHAEDITGASSRWSQIQVNLREVAFPPPHSCQQGTPGNPTSRRGRKTWKKTNHSLLLPSRQNKKEKRTWNRSCTAFAALAEISLQPVDSSASEEFALGCSSLPPDQN